MLVDALTRIRSGGILRSSFFQERQQSDGCCALVNPMLDEEPVEVRLDRPRGHPELRGDLLIGISCGDELQNLLLPGGEMRAPTFVRRLPTLHSFCPFPAYVFMLDASAGAFQAAPAMSGSSVRTPSA